VSYTWVIPHKPIARTIQKDVYDKKERDMEPIENGLLQIQLILIFASLMHFTKRFKSVDKSDEFFC